MGLPQTSCLTIRPLLKEGELDRQRVGIVVNGQEVTTLVLTEARFMTHDIVLPAQLVDQGLQTVGHLVDVATQRAQLVGARGRHAVAQVAGRQRVGNHLGLDGLEPQTGQVRRERQHRDPFALHRGPHGLSLRPLLG